MLFIWRGWGGLGFALPFIGAALGFATAGAVTNQTTAMFLLLGGFGAVLGGGAAWWLGTKLNVTSPEPKLQQHLQARRQQLEQLVRSGRFQAVPGMAPRSLEEAWAQASGMLAAEEKAARDKLFNQHTFWYIPMQHVGVVGSVIGGVLMVAGLVKAMGA